MRPFFLPISFDIFLFFFLFFFFCIFLSSASFALIFSLLIQNSPLIKPGEKVGLYFYLLDCFSSFLFPNFLLLFRFSFFIFSRFKTQKQNLGENVIDGWSYFLSRHHFLFPFFSLPLFFYLFIFFDKMKYEHCF